MESKKSKENNRFRIDDVQLSYPALHKKSVFNGAEGKYGAKFFVKKGSEAYKIITKNMKRMFSEHETLERDRTCFRIDGNGNYVFSANSINPIKTIDQNRNYITEESGLLVAGVYVNALVSLWFQKNQFGKRLNANLHAVQFLRDEGDRFSPVDQDFDVNEEFDSYGDASTEDDDSDDLYD